MSEETVARDRLIVALDVPDGEAARALVATLGDAVGFYKIGLELAFVGGLALFRSLMDVGKKVFLDLKLHEIGVTVERAASQVAGSGATFLTVRAFPQAMAAALARVGDRSLGILGVTAMTSYDDDLARAGYNVGVRAEAGTVGLILLPGVTRRPAGASAADQKRVMAPAAALMAGADHLVVGRPITRADDPRAAAERILDEMAAAG